MIGHGDFRLLKSGEMRRGTATQAEAGLVAFPQIVCNGHPADRKNISEMRAKYMFRLYWPKIPLDMANLPGFGAFVI
jgi:hypothetical protein